jgi:hypothetical protein
MSGTSFRQHGNLQNARGFLQYVHIADAQFSGSEFVFAPQQRVSCDQSVEQAASVSDW